MELGGQRIWSLAFHQNLYMPRANTSLQNDLLLYVYKNRTMNMDIQIMYVIMSIGCRTNGLSNQWVVGPMGCRTNGLSDHREVTTAHNSDSPLFRRPIVPTAHYSDDPLIRLHTYIYIHCSVYTGGHNFETLTLI